jgi:hypothetical protein
MRFIFLVFIILFSTVSYGNIDSVLARIGNKVVTVSEFRHRYELSPQVYNTKDAEKKKEYFLYTLIAEKLFALKAEEENPDTSEVIRFTFNEVERMFLRDALYKKEILDKITISEEELREAASREMYKLVLASYFHPDSITAFKVYNQIYNGASFDSVAAAGDFPVIEVEIGELRPDIEDAVYNLDIGEYTSPLRYGKGWYIFLLIQKKMTQQNSSDISSLIKSAEKKLKDLKSAHFFNEYYKQFFSGRSIEADGDIFWSIVDKLSGQMKNSQPVKGEYTFSMEDLSAVENKFGDSLSAVYVRIDNNPLTIQNFLRKLYFQGFTVTETDPGKLAANLNAAVKVILENELLTAEAYKRGFHELPDVKESLRIWKDNYLSTITTKKIADSLTKSEKSDQNDLIINIEEIYTNKLSDVESVLNELDSKKEFNEIAKNYDKLFTRDGNTTFSAASLGEVGKIAANINEGEIYGPLPVADGYLIFKLLKKEKKIAPEKIPTGGNRFNENYEAIKQAASDLAKKFGVDINYRILNNITVADQNMFTIRIMGFGGRIPAVPVISPFHQWYDLWQESLKEVP